MLAPVGAICLQTEFVMSFHVPGATDCMHQYVTLLMMARLSRLL